MMYKFLENNRQELIDRCKAKVSQRIKGRANEQQIENGLPLFLAQLICTLRAEQAGQVEEGKRISGASGGDAQALSEVGVSAAAHGKDLLKLGFSVDEVVHNYGDLCQAITDLAFERDAPFAIDEFRTLNRCLDNAIADAVTEFSQQRDLTIAEKQLTYVNEKFGSLIHELRNALNTATFSFAALETGSLPVTGATGKVLKRAITSLSKLVNSSLAEVRISAGAVAAHQVFSVAAFVEDAKNSAGFFCVNQGCTFLVTTVDPLLSIRGDRDLLLDALGNILSNAFKFTRPNTQVRLHAYAREDRVLIDVEDHGDGMPEELFERAFQPFTQHGRDRSGLGLGLSIAQKSAEASGGSLTVKSARGEGCVFTINLPLAASID